MRSFPWARKSPGEKAQEETPCYARKGGGGGLYSKKGFIGGDSAPRFNPLSFYTTIFDRKVALRLPFIDKCYPFHIPT